MFNALCMPIIAIFIFFHDATIEVRSFHPAPCVPPPSRPSAPPSVAPPNAAWGPRRGVEMACALEWYMVVPKKKTKKGQHMVDICKITVDINKYTYIYI